MDFKLLGKRIRDERLLQRLTLEKLAEKTDKSINFIGQIERGEAKPSLETLIDIANALNVTVDTLLSDNLNITNQSTSGQIYALLQEIDENGKLFLLDVVRRYVSFHRNQEHL